MTGGKARRWFDVVPLFATVVYNFNSFDGLWLGDYHILPGWWFGTFFAFPYIGNSHPN